MSFVILGAAACDDDVVNYSETVSTKLGGIKNGDINQGTASEDKNINTESGNPYGEFLKTAKSRLGRNPSEVQVTSIILRVASDSKNVIAIDEVLDDVEVFFANSQTTIPVGHLDNPAGGSVTIPVDEDLDLEPLMESMLSGDFKVGARGNAVVDPPDDFELKLTLDLRFRAIE